MTTPVILLFAYSKFSQILLNLFVGKGDVMCGIHSPVEKKKKVNFIICSIISWNIQSRVLTCFCIQTYFPLYF